MLDPDEREQVVIRLLANWPTEIPGVLIGGYAVAAYGVPRYSVDVDVVAPTTSGENWSRWLKSRDLQLLRVHRFSSPLDTPAVVERWQRGAVTVDLMTGGVRDRDSHVVIPEEWVLRASASVSLELLSGRMDHSVPVVRIAALWALKILAGRPQDITDLFGLSTQPVPLIEVRELFEGLWSPSLNRKLTAVSQSLRNPKTYVDTLSRLRRGSPGLGGNRAQWEHFVKMIEQAIPNSSSAHRE